MSVFKEIDACFPVSNYGLSKYWGEQQTKLYNDHYECQQPPFNLSI